MGIFGDSRFLSSRMFSFERCGPRGRVIAGRERGGSSQTHYVGGSGDKRGYEKRMKRQSARKMFSVKLKGM